MALRSLLLEHEFGDAVAHLDPLRFAEFRAENLRHVLEMRRARVERFVNAMADAHDLFLLGEAFFDVSIHLIERADFLSILITPSLAPPWSGPFKVPIALVMAEYMSLNVAMVTRALNVEAFMPWSACST